MTDTLASFADLAIDAFTYANENRQRVARLAAGYGLWGWGIMRILRPRSDDIDGQMEELATGALILAFGTLAHPGSLGDAHVRTDEQYSLARGMWREGFSWHQHPSGEIGGNIGWTLGRAFLGLQLGLHISPRYLGGPYFNAMAGATLLPYLADRSWSYVRAYRHHSGVHWRYRTRAFLLNQFTGNFLDTVGTLMQSALAHKLRNLNARSFDMQRSSWDGDAAMQGLAAMYAGTLFNALYTFLLAQTRFRDSLALRQVGHGLRLVARARVRRHYNDDRNAAGENVWYVFVVVDILLSWPMHRWFEPGVTAAKAISGLQRGGHSTFDLHRVSQVIPTTFPHMSPHSPLSPHSASSSRRSSALGLPEPSSAWGEPLPLTPARDGGSMSVSVRFVESDAAMPATVNPRDAKGPTHVHGLSPARPAHPARSHSARRAAPLPRSPSPPLRPSAPRPPPPVADPEDAED